MASQDKNILTVHSLFFKEVTTAARRLHIAFNLTNIHGARRAKSTSHAKANFQLRMAATAFNIRQLLRRWPKLKSSLAAA